jgi:hypothetical protein
MNCTCPKCNAPAQIDHSEIPENGTDRICETCKSRLWIYRESFGGRALKKRGEIFCVNCGGELDRTIACPSCGNLYPEYAFVQATKAAPKRTVHVRSTYYIRRRPARKPRSKTIVAAKKPIQKLSIVNKYSVSVLVLIILVVAGTTVYTKLAAEKEFSVNYVRALYGIKHGTDLSLKHFEKKSSTPDNSTSALRDTSFSLSSEEQSKLNTIRTQVDNLMKKTEKPPQKFVAAREKLNNLYGVYTNICTFALQPTGSAEESADSADKLRTEFRKSSQELKSTLPKQLSVELENARARYRSLRDF